MKKNWIRSIAGFLAMLMMLLSITDYASIQAMAKEDSIITLQSEEVTENDDFVDTEDKAVSDNATRYTITYELNGGEFTSPYETFYEEGVGCTLPIPYKKGYGFKGWFLDKELKQAIETVSSNMTGDITVHADWKAYNYKVRFNGNGADGFMPDQSFVYDTRSVIRKCKFKKTGYTFSYWSVSDNNMDRYLDTEKVSSVGVPEYEDQVITLVANWQPNDDTAKFYVKYFNVYDGGIPVPFTQKERGTYAVRDSYKAFTKLTMPAASRMKKTGYIFKGWYTDENCQNKLKITDTMNKSLAIYAKWTTWNYYVKFNKMGGKGTMAQYPVHFGNDEILPECTLRKKGYTFIGWANTKNLATRGIVNVEDRASVKGLVEDSVIKNNNRVILYAVWKPNEYKINYVNSIGTIESCLEKYETGSKYNFSSLRDKTTFEKLPSYVVSGNFLGWFAKPSLKKKAAITKKTAGELNFYAKWDFDYVIDYSNGGLKDVTGQMSQALRDYSQNQLLDTNQFKRSGYSFMGWAAVSANGCSIRTGASPENFTEEDIAFKDGAKLGCFNARYISDEKGRAVLHLVPVWGKEGKLVFITNGGTFNNPSVSCNEGVYYSIYKYNSSIAGDKLNSMYKPLREDYDFQGWYLDEALTVPAEIQAGTTGTVVLYAKWKGNASKIVFHRNYGADKTKKQTVYIGKAKKLTKNPFKRKGYVFLGWAVSANATTPDFTNKQVVKFDNRSVSGNIISVSQNCISARADLYAVWQPIYYQAIFKDVTLGRSYIIKYTIDTGLSMRTAADILQENYFEDDYRLTGIYKNKKLIKYGKDIPAGKVPKKPAVYYISWS